MQYKETKNKNNNNCRGIHGNCIFSKKQKGDGYIMGVCTFTDARKKARINCNGDVMMKDKIPYDGFARVVCPDGTYIDESCYEGYQMFGGRNIFELAVEWNKGHLYEAVMKRQQTTNNRLNDIPDEAIHKLDEGKDDEARKIMEDHVAKNGLPDIFLTDYKRFIGIYISAETTYDTAIVPFPIKIIRVKQKPKYEDLGNSEVVQ